MSIFSKLFGKAAPSEPFVLAPVSEMMGEDPFWKIVAASINGSGGDQDRQEAILINSLERLTPAEIVGFRLRTDKLLYDTYTSDMWCAGYLIKGGCSDDMFEYFRLWVISKGRDVYEKARANPDSLSDQMDENEEFYDFESFWYVALTAFKNKTGKELYDHIAYDNFKYGEGNYQQFDFTWEEEDPESMKKICPRLFERFDNPR
ncbi:MAG: DUF4240 domain-containing protein [Acidobacteriota bacterium]